MAQTKLKPTSSSTNIFIPFLRGLKLGLINFWRNKFLSIATIMVMAVILLVFNTILAVNFISSQALQALNKHVDIIIYLRDDINFDEAQNLTQTLQNISGIKTATYRSKEQALQIVSKMDPKTVDFIKKFELKNPLPPSISITLEKPEDYQKVQTILKQDSYQNLMNKDMTENSNNENNILSSVAQNVSNINSFARQIIFWIVLIFVLGGTLVIVNTIQLTIYTRRNEIYIMRLVGATPNFIRLPFIFEGIIYSVVAVLISFLLLFLLGKTLQIGANNLWIYYQDLQLEKIFIAELLMTSVLGISSSFSAVEQYLKTKVTLS